MKFSFLNFIITFTGINAVSSNLSNKSNEASIDVSGDSTPFPVELPPQVQALEIAHGAWKAQALRSFITTGIVDSMVSLCTGGKHASVSAIAKASNSKVRPTYRLLRFLSTFDVVEENDKGEFALGPIGEVCTKSHPNSVVKAVVWESSETNNRPWLFMDDFIKEDKNVAKQAFGNADFFSYLVGSGKPFAEFREGMTHLTTEEGFFLKTAFISPTFDLSPYQTICDLGCAEGTAALAMNERYSNAHYILADLPESVDRIDESSLPPNFETSGIDFLENVPKADAYFLKHIIHNSDDDRSKTIFKNIKKANADAHIFIAEFGPMPGPNVPHLAKGFDLHMALFLDGAERTQDEYDQLWAANGLELVNIHIFGEGAIPLYVQELKHTALRP